MAQSASRRNWKPWAAALAAVLLVLAAATWLLGAGLLSRAVEARLRAAGFDEVSVGGVSPGWSAVRIGQLDFGESGSLSDVTVNFTLADLVTGHRPTVEIGRLIGRATLAGDNTASIPGFSPAAGAGGTTALPLSAIDIREARLRAATPWGPLTLDGADLEALAQGEDIDLAGDVALTTPFGQLRGRSTGTANLQSGEFSLVLTITDGTLQTAIAGIRDIAGEIDLQKPASASPTAEFDLTAAPQIAGADRLRLQGQWMQQRLEARVIGTEDAGGGTDLAVTADFSGDRPQLSGAGTWAIAGAEPTGLIRFDAQVSLDTAAKPITLEGQVAAQASGLAYPGWVTAADLALDAALAGTGENLRLTLNAPLTGGFRPVADLVPAPLSSYAGRRLEFIAGAEDGARLDLTADTLTTALSLDVREADGTTTAQISGPLTAEMGGAGVRLEMPRMQATAAGLRWQESVASALTYNGTTRIAGPDDWSLEGTVEIEATGALGPARYEGLRLDWSGVVRAEGPAIRLTPADCVAMRFERLSIGPATLSGITPPCLGTPEATPILVSTRDDLEFNVAVPSEAPLDLTVETETPRHVTGIWPGGVLWGTYGPEGGTELTAELSGATLRLEADRAVLSEITANAELAHAGALSAGLRVGTIRSLHAPAYWAPLNLEISVDGTPVSYDFSAILSDSLGILVLEAAGSGTPERGNAALTLYPLHFLPGATEAGDLSPLLAETVSDMSGTVSFDGEVAWGETLSSGGRLTMEGLAATLSSARLEGLEAEIDFSSLWPLAIAEEETIRIARIDTGVPLTDGVIGLEKAPDAAPRAGPIAFDLAGGTVTAAPFILDLGAGGETRFTMIAEGVDLERMIEEADIDGLSGTGTLAGRLPVALSADGLRVDDGGLQAVTTGRLQYRPSVLPPFLQGDDTRATMLRQVLQNFEYSQLSLSLAGGSGDNASQRVSLAAKGNNPDFLEGHPVELNFDFEGAILNALKSAVSITGSDALERLLREQEREDAE